MKRNKFTHICIAFNVYALLQYLLNMEENVVVNNTHFFVGSGIPEPIREALPHATYFPTDRVHGIAMCRRRFQKLYLALFSHILYPELRTAKIYAQDHQYLSAVLIGKREYSFLSDSAQILSLQMNPGCPVWNQIERKKNSIGGKIENLLYGNLSTYQYASSNQCVEVLLTAPNQSPVLQLGRKGVKINSFYSLWTEMSNTKRKTIEQCMALDEAEVYAFSQADVVVLTQPFYSDNVLTASEHYNTYSRIIDNYPNQKVLIKPHPRDTFDYVQFFSKRRFDVVRSHIPFEMIVLEGANINRVVTFFSSSVNIVGDSVKIDWYGTAGNSKLEKEYGVIKQRLSI